MIAFGLLLLAVAVALVFVAVWEGGGTLAVEAFDFSADIPLWGVFVAGVATGMIALAGIVAMSSGARRKRERAREFEYLRQRVAKQEVGEDDGEPEVRQWLGGAQAGGSTYAQHRPSAAPPRTAATYRSPHT